MESTDLSADLTDLFNLDVHTTSVATLPSANDSADCTNDGCTASCQSCGCR